ncbi:MAG: hypothetical protein K2O95_07655 [Clostridia bacterium]|nr:hypothetical protein [Clostridia bacterium]
MTTKKKRRVGRDMKKFLAVLILVVCVISVFAFSSCNGNEGPAEPAAPNERVLVVYFTWSSNTESMANYISQKTGGTLYELQPLVPYPKEYTPCTEVALKERDENARPKIKDLIGSVDEYDAIFIGYPIWWHTAPMIIGTFLESFDLSGKDIYPFTQSASMNREQFENSMQFVRDCAKGANVHDGLFARYSDTRSIDKYIDECDLQ